MRTFTSLVLMLVMSILSLKSAISQHQYSTYQLPTPQNLSSFFVGPITGSGLYYGATPSNVSANSPVIVYVHGFIDLNNLWFSPGNSMYDETYNANYRCAFVATTRGEGMWTNGDIFADMLDDITRHYGVNDVVIVAHSNGGKTSEVAMTLHNKKNKINRVITLGTPFFGTELANLAETPAFNWLVNFIGLGGGTSTSTTYYMGGFARPLLDWNWNNQPQKFINFGSWGYNNGTTLLAPTMLIGGNLLNWMGSGSSVGGNDGVTPYWSSTRPNGNPQWTTGHGNPVSQFDHADIAYSYVMWNSIEPLFTAPLSSLRNKVPASTKEVETSSIQLVSSEDQNMIFTVEEGKATEIAILHETANFSVELVKLTANGDQIPCPIDLTAIQQTQGYLKGYATAINLPRLDAGDYQLLSNNKFAAVVNQKNGVVLEFSNEHKYIYNNQKAFRVNLRQANEYDLTQAKVKALITHVNGLDGNPLETPVTTIETLKLDENGYFQVDMPNDLMNGTYNMVIQVQHPKFQRSLVTGFVVNEKAPIVNTSATLIQSSSLLVYPNPATDFIQISFEQNTPNGLLNLYDINGRLLLQKAINDLGTQQHTIDLKALNLGQGIYFVELQDGKHKQTTTFQKVK